MDSGKIDCMKNLELTATIVLTSLLTNRLIDDQHLSLDFPQEMVFRRQIDNKPIVRVPKKVPNYRLNRQNRRKYPLLFSETGKRFLMNYFEHTPLPSSDEKRGIADELGVTYHQIDIWFRNRRQTLARLF